VNCRPGFLVSAVDKQAVCHQSWKTAFCTLWNCTAVQQTDCGGKRGSQHGSRCSSCGNQLQGRYIASTHTGATGKPAQTRHVRPTPHQQWLLFPSQSIVSGCCQPVVCSWINRIEMIIKMLLDLPVNMLLLNFKFLLQNSLWGTLGFQFCYLVSHIAFWQSVHLVLDQLIKTAYLVNHGDEMKLEIASSHQKTLELIPGVALMLPA
jgi:hypothetical protein